MLKKIFLIIFCCCATCAFSQLRTFNEIFPAIQASIRTSILTDSGYVNTSRKVTGFAIIGSQRSTLIDSSIINNVLRSNPGYIVESISIIPGNRTVTLLDVYNALGNIRDLKGRLYNSATRNQEIPLFEDATRIAGEKQTNAIPDPPPSRTLPQTETVYLRLRDVNFGNTFYRGEMALIQSSGRVHGLSYTLTNFRSMNYLMVPVIREGKFIAQLYFEPIREGILIYSLAGADISDFFASRIHVDSAISKRLAVITAWAADGIRRN